ncbi:MAG: LytTR family DNA-binding domain-containing protein [Bacteroidota bacterium]
MKYTVLIVDDEEPARDLLVSYARKIEELEVLPPMSNAMDARKVINEQSVDILLTDIQMDDLTGIDLIKTLKQPPITIFTTAYSEYALEGFELDIADYLVKPISFQRFYKAINKTIELIQFKTSNTTTPPPKVDSLPSSPKADYFFVKTNRKMVKTVYADILFVESYGEYVKIHTKDDLILALQTTQFMEQLLPEEDFVRIHRSYIVNLNHIQEIDGPTLIVEQHRLTISKRMRDGFMKRVQQKGII